MLASEPGIHRPARTTWSFVLLIFFSPCAPLVYCLTSSFLFKVPAPGGSTSTKPEPAPADSGRIRILQYCGAFLSSSPTVQHISPKKKQVASEIYSIPSVVR